MKIAVIGTGGVGGYFGGKMAAAGFDVSFLPRDIWEGKPSEIEYQNGTVVKLGKKHGVPTPVNEFIYYCVMPMEKKARENRH